LLSLSNLPNPASNVPPFETTVVSLNAPTPLLTSTDAVAAKRFDVTMSWSPSLSMSPLATPAGPARTVSGLVIGCRKSGWAEAVSTLMSGLVYVASLPTRSRTKYL
jgi:hypothetical protein